MFASLASAAAFAHPGFGFFPFFFLGPLIWLIIIVLIIVFAVTGRRRRAAMWAQYGGRGPWGWGGPWGGHGWQGHAARNAEATLAERFAQGDIDETEYRARLEVLRANNGVTPPPAQ